MPDTYTDNYDFTLPDIGASRDTWGDKNNDNWSRLDQMIFERFEAIDAAIAAAAAPLRAWIDDRIGEVGWCAAGTQPSNVLIPRGQTVSRDTYPKLFAKIGTTFNTGGESSTEFRLPSVQDRYIRATQTGDATGLGELLDDTIGVHTHEASTGGAGKHRHTGTTQGGGRHDHGGQTDSGGGHTPSITVATYAEGHSQGVIAGGDRGRFNGNASFNANAVPSHRHGIPTQGDHTHSFTTSEQPDHTHSVTVAEAGGVETRPKTIRFIPVIYCDWE